MNTFVTVDRDPSGVDPEIAATVAAILNILVKSITSIKMCISLLRLPEEIQNAPGLCRRQRRRRRKRR